MVIRRHVSGWGGETVPKDKHQPNVVKLSCVTFRTWAREDHVIRAQCMPRGSNKQARLEYPMFQRNKLPHYLLN